MKMEAGYTRSHKHEWRLTDRHWRLLCHPAPPSEGNGVMAKNIPRTGKKVRPKTAVKGKRFLCAKCRKRSPRPVKTPAPWYCPNCLAEKDDSAP